MNRKANLEKAFQRGHILNLNNPLYKNWIDKFIVDETRGDIGTVGVITSNAVIKNNNGRVVRLCFMFAPDRYSEMIKFFKLF